MTNQSSFELQSLMKQTQTSQSRSNWNNSQGNLNVPRTITTPNSIPVLTQDTVHHTGYHQYQNLNSHNKQQTTSLGENQKKVTSNLDSDKNSKSSRWNVKPNTNNNNNNNNNNKNLNCQYNSQNTSSRNNLSKTMNQQNNLLNFQTLNSQNGYNLNNSNSNNNLIKISTENSFTNKNDNSNNGRSTGNMHGGSNKSTSNVYSFPLTSIINNNQKKDMNIISSYQKVNSSSSTFTPSTTRTPTTTQLSSLPSSTSSITGSTSSSVTGSTSSSTRPTSYYSHSNNNSSWNSYQQNSSNYRSHSKPQYSSYNRNNNYNNNNNRYYNNRNNNRYGGNNRFNRRHYNERVIQGGIEQQKIPFRKNFFVEHPEITNMTYNDVQQLRMEKELKLFGNCDCKPFTKFEHGFFPEKTLQQLKDKGWTGPSPIQSQTWPISLQGHDLIGVAETGSGKTLSFLIPAFVHILDQRPITRGDGPICLILAPTRELAIQIKEVSEEFGRTINITSNCVYGGVSRGSQIQELRRGGQIIVATPGRLIDFIKSEETNLNRVTFLVLDEADQMLDMGFEPQIREIVDKIRIDRQTLMFSATWPKSVRKLGEELTTNPIRVNVGKLGVSANKHIKQTLIFLNQMEKNTKILEILQKIHDGSRILIFTQTKIGADNLSNLLSSNGFRSAPIHGDKSQFVRERTLNRFRNSSCPILVATDVASRGLDVKDIKYVVNYDFPSQIEDYVHRIGRTARYGKEGHAVSFFTQSSYRLAGKMIKILRDCEQPIPHEFDKYSHQWVNEKRSKGKSNYGWRNRQNNYYRNNNRFSFNRNHNNYNSKFKSNQFQSSFNRSSYNHNNNNNSFNNFNNNPNNDFKNNFNNKFNTSNLNSNLNNNLNNNNMINKNPNFNNIISKNNIINSNSNINSNINSNSNSISNINSNINSNSISNNNQTNYLKQELPKTDKFSFNQNNSNLNTQNNFPQKMDYSNKGEIKNYENRKDDRSYERRRDERRSHERRSHERRSHERRSHERRSHERRSHERRDVEKSERRREERGRDDRSHERRSHERRSHERRSHERRSHERRSHERRDERRDERREDRRRDDRNNSQRSYNSSTNINKTLPNQTDLNKIETTSNSSNSTNYPQNKIMFSNN
ncbi:atp-dependent RNA helicase ddx5-related [Anaeramoeba flamelloides]|uniref:RNA helicase n=1 Tax=Anaeramoeba flamelloides TaxID=1746091 RepID=A0ABQ8XLC0_9EUKA|nr:atp-dependent RNA helicase ddx5-related [Anaeramoeba flamelloides]